MSGKLHTKVNPTSKFAVFDLSSVKGRSNVTVHKSCDT
jgi:hypothetical protein